MHVCHLGEIVKKKKEELSLYVYVCVDINI